MDLNKKKISVEVTDPTRIAVSKNTTKLLSFVTEKIEQFNNKKLSDDQKDKLSDAINEPNIRVSLGIEGIEIRRGDTLEANKLRKITSEIKHSEKRQATINLLDATDLIYSSKTRKLDLEFIKEIHYQVGKGVYSHAGTLREDMRSPREELDVPIPAALINMIEEMSIYFNIVDDEEGNNAVHPIVLSCWLHNIFTKLHPFVDGNGRTARILQDWVLVKNGYFPVSSGSLRRERYLDLLEEADQENWTEFVTSLAEAQSDVIARANEAVNASQYSDETLDKIIQGVSAKRSTGLSDEYQNWRHHMERMVSSFENRINYLNEKVKNRELYVRMIRNDIIEQSKWEIIREEGTDLQNNAFLIYWNHQDFEFYKTIAYYARHYRRRNVDPVFRNKDIDKSVSLYLGGHDLPSELDYPRKAIPLKTKEGKLWGELPFQDPKIATREILIGEGSILRYRNVPQGVGVDIENTSVTLSERKHESWLFDEVMPDIITSDYASEVFSKTNVSS